MPIFGKYDVPEVNDLFRRKSASNQFGEFLPAERRGQGLRWDDF
jgi:hypothetical protein